MAEVTSMGSGAVPVDLELLFTAFEDHAAGRRWYLDRASGAVWFVSDGSDDDRLPVALEELERSPRFVPVCHESAYDAYRDMAEFAEQVEPPLREWLEHALAGKCAPRRFLRALRQDPEARARWIRFRDARVEARARKWLEECGIFVAPRMDG